MRIADSSSGTDGYADDKTKTARGTEQDFPNHPRFAGDRIYYGFSKGDATTTTFYAGRGGVIYARRGSTTSGRTLHARFKIDSLPGEPRAGSPSVSVQGPNNVVLSWRAPTDTGGIPLSGYRVLKNDGSGWQYAGNTRSTSINISGLSANTTYQFLVGAHSNVSKAHGSTYTDIGFHTGPNLQLFATTDSDVQAPTAFISARATSQTSVFVEWGTSSGNAAPTSVSVIRNDINQTFSNQPSGSTTFTGLTPNTNYTYDIVASNSAGTAREDANARTPLPKPTLSIIATAIDSTSARVRWTSSDASSVQISGTNLNSTALSDNVIVEGLEPGGIYSWGGTATNRDGSTSTTSNRIQLPNIIGGVWNGAEWGLPEVKRWNGSSWSDTSTFVWTGNEWKLWAS